MRAWEAAGMPALEVDAGEPAPATTNDMPDDVRTALILTSARMVLEQELPGHAVLVVVFPPQRIWRAVWTEGLQWRRLFEMLMDMTQQVYARMRNGG